MATRHPDGMMLQQPRRDDSSDSPHRPSRTARRAADPAPPEALGPVQAVADAVPDAVLVTEPGGELRFTNDAANQLFAGRPVVDRDDLLSRFEPVTIDRPEALPPAGRAATRDGAVIVRQRNRPNRWFAMRTVPLVAHAEPVEQGPDVSLAFVLRDVTETRDLRPIREAFLGLVSHELRTPITTIYAGSSVLARQPGLSLPATRTLAQDVSAEAARLYDLVEDLLVLARMERGVLDPLEEPILLDRVVDGAIRLVGERHPAAVVSRRGSADGVAVRADATYVDQAVRNAVFAAMRRPGQAPKPRLVIEVRPHDRPGEVAVAIRDAGPAIDGHAIERVFDLPDATDHQDPSPRGLGLFVARQLVEAMGGRAWAFNRPEGGIEIGFALPVVEPA
jgi:signal transduction histidine kinase